VVAAARNAQKAAEVFTEAGLTEGYQQEEDSSSGILLVESNVDVTNPSTLTAELFEGVTQASLQAAESCPLVLHGRRNGAS
jgi:hypothetical protein